MKRPFEIKTQDSVEESTEEGISSMPKDKDANSLMNSMATVTIKKLNCIFSISHSQYFPQENTTHQAASQDLSSAISSISKFMTKKPSAASTR